MIFCHMCPGSSGVEQWTENPRVGGSNPPPGTIKNGKYAKLSRHCLVSVPAFYPKFYTEVKECDQGLFDTIKGTETLYYKPFAFGLCIGLVVLMGESSASGITS